MASTALRSRPAILLIGAALLMSLILGAGFIAVHRLDQRGVTAKPPRGPLTDEQSMAQVVEPARQFVAAGRLREASGSYILLSCTTGNEPPYQGTVYIGFDVPSITDTPAYFRSIARAMSARGWTEGLPPNNHPGGKLLTRDGISAVYYRNPDLRGRGVLQIYGECRNVTDHRLDPTGFLDISASLYG